MNLTGFEGLIKYLNKQKEWSSRTFRGGRRTVGITEHIKKEISEVIDDPDSPDEWIDIVILALDGAWRTGATSEQIVSRLLEKQAINFERHFPVPASDDHISEHSK